MNVNPTRLAHGLADTAVEAVRHPVASVSRAAGLVKGAAHAARRTPAILTETIAARTGAQRADQAGQDSAPAARPDPAAPQPGSRAGNPVPDEPAPPTGVPDLEPPDPANRVLVVEEALAAEQEPERFGRTTEPHAASHDEAHGHAGLQRAELEELDEEAEARE